MGKIRISHPDRAAAAIDAKIVADTKMEVAGFFRNYRFRTDNPLKRLDSLSKSYTPVVIARLQGAAIQRPGRDALRLGWPRRFAARHDG
jgi:hypothetical protein